MNHLDVLEQLARRWDGVMCDIDRMPGEAAFLPIHGRAAYLKFLDELARCARTARDELAALMADDPALADGDVHIPVIGTVRVDNNKAEIQ